MASKIKISGYVKPDTRRAMIRAMKGGESQSEFMERALSALIRRRQPRQTRTERSAA